MVKSETIKGSIVDIQKVEEVANLIEERGDIIISIIFKDSGVSVATWVIFYRVY